MSTQTTPPQDLSALLALLDVETQTLAVFADILQREHDALRNNHTDTLASLVQEKSRLAEQLNALNLQRSQLLARQQLASDRASMERLAHQHAHTQSGQRLGALWQRWLELATAAQQLNAGNGVLIGTRLTYNQHLLHALQAATDQATLYGPDGQTQATSSGRHFGSA